MESSTKHYDERQKGVVPPPPRVRTVKHGGGHVSGRWTRRILVIAGVLLIGAIAGFGGGLTARYATDILDRYIARPVDIGSKDGNTVVTADEEIVASVVEQVKPSVVSIITTNQVRSFYGVMDQEGAGTGVIISADGYVMTNNHVIDGADAVSVVTSDGDTYDNVQVIGSDPLNDVAFLRIRDVKNLTPAKIGDSSSIRIGQRVIAIGNALGQYQNTVTSGIVSGLGRPVTASAGNNTTETLTDLIQTDAAINSGNSGGPLVNVAGQVIGINTAVATDANNIGFAIPINATKGVMGGVLEKGAVSRAYLGVQYVNITPEVAKQFELRVRRGAYVYSENGKAVVSGSPAEKAGIQDGDIITKVDDQRVGEDGSVGSLVGQHRPGDEVSLTILRDAKTQVLKVTLAEY